MKTTHYRFLGENFNSDALKGLGPDEVFETERDLEDALVANPDVLMDGLWLVGRQIQTDAGRIDLLGVDPRGPFYLFELKVGKLSRGAVSQAIEYAAFLNDLKDTDIFSLITNGSGRNGISQITDFRNEFEARYGSAPFPDGVAVWPILVSQEYDEPAARSIDWLHARGVNIEYFVLRAYQIGDAISFEVYENPSPPVRRWWYPPAGAKRSELVEWIEQQAAETEAAALWAEIHALITTAFPIGRWVPRVDPYSLGLAWEIKRSDGKYAEGIIIRIENYWPNDIYLLLYEETLQYAPRKLRAALRPYHQGRGMRLGKPHGELRWIEAATWSEHGAELREALAYAGAKFRKVVK